MVQLENPVLNRELIENLRSPKAFFMQALFVVLLGGIVLVAWPQEIELATKEQKSIEIYDTFARGQLVLLALLAPILSAPAISSERERSSLDLLLTSPLSATAIVLGKLLSAVVYLLLLAISSLPVFSVCFRLGAVGPLEVMSTYLVLFSMTIVCGSIGLAASAFMGRSRAALSVSYVTILPLAMLLMFANPMRFLPAAIAFSVLSFVVSLVLVVLVQRRLREPFDTAPKAADEEDHDEQIGLVLDRRRFPDNLLSAKSEGLPIDEQGNPVYDKELRHELFGQGTLLVRLLLQVSLVAALPFFIASLAAQGLWVYTFYVLIFVMLLAPSLSAGVFTQERERGTLDLLLTTSLTKGQILRAKLLVNFRNISILTGFLFPFIIFFWIIAVWTGNVLPPEVNWWHLTGGSVAVIVSTAFFVVMLACFFSMLCRTTLRSMVFTYLTLSGLYVVPLVLYRVLTRFASMNDQQAHWFAITSPFYALATIESQSLRRFGILLNRNTAEPHILWYASLSIVSGLILAIAIWLLYDRHCQFRHDRGH